MSTDQDSEGLDFSVSPDPVLDRLMSLHPKEIDLSLGRVLALLEKLGNPHLKLPSVIHVAGTNGKGSTVAFLRSVLEAAGLTVHAYTSPHLVRFAERIRLAGSIIDETLLTMMLEEVEQVNAGEPITFFEVTTATAFKAFSEVPADVLLLETGLGGRLDATNVVPDPIACILTPISRDHERFLGSDISSIAAEKAAILKPGAVCVSTHQLHEAAQPIREAAEKVGADVAWQNDGWKVSGSPGGGGVFEGRHRTWRLPTLGLAGGHQVDNAGAALAALEALDFVITDEAVAQGLANVDWPARAHRLSQGPLVDMLPERWEMWLDGGHNEGAAQVLAQLVRRWSGRPIHMICGMMEAKNHQAFLEILSPHITRFTAVPINGEPNALSTANLATLARDAGIKDIHEASDATEALAVLRTDMDTGKPAVVLACGSLYLAGQILRENS